MANFILDYRCPHLMQYKLVAKCNDFHLITRTEVRFYNEYIQTSSHNKILTLENKIPDVNSNTEKETNSAYNKPQSTCLHPGNVVK